MSFCARPRRRTASLAAPLFALLLLSGCSSIGDLGQLQPDLVTDSIHDWVGRDAARHAGAPVSADQLTDDERMLRDLAFPLIEPPYDRQRWNAIVYEYGIDRQFRRSLWIDDPTDYYRHLLAAAYISPAGRYNRLLDDIRDDIVRIGPFFVVARRVVDLDQRRLASMQYVADLSPQERLSAEARVGENSLTIAWVQHALAARCAGYRYALEHLAVAAPNPAAANVDVALTEMQQQIGVQQLVPESQFAAIPVAAAAGTASKPR